MKKLLTIVAFYFLILGISSAEAEWLYNKKPITDSPYAKTDGEFGALLAFTDKPDELFEAWNKEGLEVKADFVDKIKLNQRLVAVIVFSNSAADKRGNSNLTALLTVFDPQGNAIVGKELKVWVNRPSPPYRDLELSVDHLAITVEDGMPTGLYMVKAMVYDKIAGKILDLERQFEVTE